MEKTPNDPEKLHPQISQSRGKKKGLPGGMWVFSARYHSIYLKKIIPVFLKKNHLTMAVFLKYMIILELGEIPCFNDFINVLMICLN